MSPGCKARRLQWGRRGKREQRSIEVSDPDLEIAESMPETKWMRVCRLCPCLIQSLGIERTNE